jgi:ABC-type proline/glycine betaine transport system ATPase subunit
MSDTELTNIRRDHIGFVFQQFNLLPLLNAVENIEFPLILKCRKRQCGMKPYELMRAIGLDKELDTHKPSELSGGQQQRVAIARALVNDPEIIPVIIPWGDGYSLSNLERKQQAVELRVEDGFEAAAIQLSPHPSSSQCPQKDTGGDIPPNSYEPDDPRPSLTHGQTT